ncbi:hypothetical protein RHMOL_Rhmol11G0083400 [Rhododendron molle]|uniref:Uncharacterized protein n=1 Tax=Rhododendron molle TaxID=49168 RepID=A0ACC0LQ35_RHOML|nr:hypothetical protein RHMOL_Rhmol11G0083400 [Rhododendron molle]
MLQSFLRSRKVNKREVPPAHYTFKIDSFSLLSNILSTSQVEKYESDIFEAGGYNWKLEVYPKGCSSQSSEYLCLGILLADSVSLPPERQLYARLCIRDQIRGQHEEITDAACFSTSRRDWIYKKFLSLRDLHDPSRGFLVNDTFITLIVEGQIKAVTAVTRLILLNN